MTPLRDEEIGGAIVRRRIGRGDLPALLAGQTLTRETFLEMPAANRRALVDGEYVAVVPMAKAAPDLDKAERMVVHRGGGLYDVIVGYRLNEAGMSKDDAEELATRPA